MRQPILSKNTEDLPPPLQSFEHINRYWDQYENCVTAKILPGEYYVTVRDEAIVTVLGSCVSACIRDRALGVGGMNHFMLPKDGNTDNKNGVGCVADDAARYGVYAMELLINSILKNGGRREYLEVKIVGGGSMFASQINIGMNNVVFVEKFLATEGLSIAVADVGDVYPRKVYYTPANGKMRVKKLRSMNNGTISEREQDYFNNLQIRPVQGEVDLF